LNIAFSGLFVIVLVLVPISAIGSDIDSLRVWRSPEKTRLVIDLSEQVKHQLITLQNPDRLVIDISDAKFKANIKQLDLSKTSILKIRHAVRNSNDLRVVLDLKGSVSPKSFALEANEKSGYRLVVDLYDKKQQVSKTVAKMLKRNDRKIVIAIDAGHGGEDPGASGPK